MERRYVDIIYLPFRLWFEIGDSEVIAGVVGLFEDCGAMNIRVGRNHWISKPLVKIDGLLYQEVSKRCTNYKDLLKINVVPMSR
jgi:hypothetical protein